MSGERDEGARRDRAHRAEFSGVGVTRRLGLLACDAVWEPLRSRHGDYPDMIAHWLESAGADFELVTWAAHQGQLPARVDDCEAWIVSGSRAGVYEPLPWIAPLIEFVRAARVARRPQLGICFGHQLLAHALGGRTERASTGWGIGNVAVRLRETAAGAPPRAALDLHVAHQDQVVTLPPGAAWLAATDHCAHAMFALGKHVLGLQPHPEFTADFMREMTRDESFELYPAQRATALASYETPADNTVVGRWAADFLGLNPAPRASAWTRWQAGAAENLAAR